MESTTRLITADELFEMPDEDGFLCELEEGRLIKTMAPGALHGVVAGRLFAKLLQFVEERELGLVFPQDTGFKLTSDPDTVRAPDIAFVRLEQVPSTGIPEKYWPGPPDLAVEVLSPNDRKSEVAIKIDKYFRRGVRLVWLIDPLRQTATVYRQNGTRSTLDATGVLDGGDVLPGFRCELRTLFETGRQRAR